MQLLTIAIYNAFGDRRTIDLRPGALNVITGIGGTGKSALLDIVEYCLGRDTATMPYGPITRTVTWYAVLFQIGDGRALVGRPAPREGRASSSQAMLEFGAEVEVPASAEDLHVNSDTDSLREELGRRIGMGETGGEPGAVRSPQEAGLGQAMLLCFQGQNEIANRDQLFHRQGEPGMTQALQDTLPYFLGAIPADQALKRQQLQNARRAVRRLESEVQAAARLNENVEVELQALIEEAYGEGLLSTSQITGRVEMLAALHEAVGAPQLQAQLDDQQLARREELQTRRGRLRSELREIAAQRHLLEEQSGVEDAYEHAVGSQTSRLTSLALMGHDTTTPPAGCPICGQELLADDPTVDDLRRAAEDLQAQLAGVEATRPRREAVLTELDARADVARSDLRAVELALQNLTDASAEADDVRDRAVKQEFTKGRIDHYLSGLRLADDRTLADLRERLRRAQLAVASLETELDPDEEREQLTSRLRHVSHDMTRWAERLNLEHHRGEVRLDLRRLTVVTDTEQGPVPLRRIGSGGNWVGYHIVAHLALHRYFVRQDRPVPHILMLDQPTQAYYPNDLDRQRGVAATDAAQAAVLRIFELLRDVAAELSREMQIIVPDHANLPEPWFQEAVRTNWRDGRKLIPDEWIIAAGGPWD